jgi:hypothetical protein
MDAMKFQIVLRSLPAIESIATGHTHLATCATQAWVSSGPLRVLGDSREDALNRMTKFIQSRLDALDGEVVEVDLEPKGLRDPEPPEIFWGD